MTGTVKRKALIIFGIVILITILLAISLPGLEFEPGMPLPAVENKNVVVAAPQQDHFEVISINRFLAIFFGILLTITIVFIIYKVIKRSSWKDIFNVIRILIGLGLLMVFIIWVILMMPRSEGSPPVSVPLPTPEPPVTAPLGPVPSYVLWLVGLSLLVVGILIFIWIYRSSQKQTTAIDLLGLEAEKAREEIRIGIGLKDVILKCYKQMSRVMEEDREIERRFFMTTGEFEKLLSEAGVPGEPVHELTRLFDAARYGNWQPTTEDEQKAIDCLEAIISFCQASREMS
ncbi:DUF4129 domain-containing protein [Leptolinea tardivitalis]|nr:DUF4129 domain-containing protein [Leptolinea tardivitalis]GAP21473.1 hypothetical protein LTAR_01684 [Leptolinea tardivitalis]